MPQNRGMRAVIVVPCYNEAERLPVEEFRTFSSAHQDLRFLFVDDGSRDRTREVLNGLASSLEGRGEVLVLGANSGKGEAVRQGMLAASDAPLVAFWDADLATPLDEIPRFMELFRTRPALELVMGSRVKLLGRDVRRRASRHYLGRVAATAISQILGLAVYDTQCGAKMFRGGARLQQMLAEPFVSRWLFDVELLARLKKTMLSADTDIEDAVIELPLMTWRDVAGSKIRSTDFLRAGSDLLKIARKYKPRQTHGMSS